MVDPLQIIWQNCKISELNWTEHMNGVVDMVGRN